MIRPALIIALPVAVWLINAKPALPDASNLTLSAPGEDDGSIAWIIHRNTTTERGEYPIALDVEGYGTITGTLTVHPSLDPDTIVILDVPEGLAVIPPGVTTAEGAVSVLRVFPAVGF